MNRENALILTALGDFLHQRRTKLREREYDWSALLQCGEQHRLNGIVFYQLRDQIPQPFRAEYHTEYLAEIVRYRHRQELVRQLDEVLQRSGVAHFYVKGDLIGALYTNPMLRSVSDVDLMVPEQQLPRLHEELVAAGFENTEQGETVWVYSKERTIFEVHTALIESSHREDDAIADYLSHCWDSVRQGALDWNVHMIYLLLHLRKHFRATGVGFRLFLDLAFVSRKAGLDWGYIRKEMEQLGLWRFTLTVLNLCDVWFDTHCAPERLSLDNSFVVQSTDAIFRNGVFGFANEKNRQNDVLNTARSESLPGLLKLAFFPGYWDLSYRNEYRFLRNRPWLLPAAWVWHLILFIAQGKVSKWFRSIIRLRSKLATRNDIYEQWGL